MKDQIQNDIVNILWTTAKPFALPSVVILVATYVILFIISKYTKKKLPREIKTAIPLVIGAIYYIIFPLKFGIYAFAYGIANGAVVSACYDIIIRRIKKKVHGEKDA